VAGPRVDEVLYQLAEAFDGRGLEQSNESQALLTNLATVTEDEWRALPPGATRTIEAMVLHVAGCKIMYADYAFGSGTKQWGTPEVEGPWESGAAPMRDAVGWLRETHRTLIGSVERLDDADLDKERPTNWGEMRPTRWILAAMVGHDFYHAGEINHLRSLLGTDDRWRWQQLTEPKPTAS
jgi:uncharacterized damage-inducible protein DinB